MCNTAPKELLCI